MTSEDIGCFNACFSLKTEKILDFIAPDDPKRGELSNLLQKLHQYRHMDSLLEKKNVGDKPSLIRITLETGDTIYEQTVDGPTSLLHPLLQNIVVLFIM